MARGWWRTLFHDHPYSNSSDPELKAQAKTRPASDKFRCWCKLCLNHCVMEHQTADRMRGEEAFQTEEQITTHCEYTYKMYEIRIEGVFECGL